MTGIESLSWPVGACQTQRVFIQLQSRTFQTLDGDPWRGLLARNRCVVPATSFCAFAGTRPSKTPVWFALSEDRPVFAFTGLWTSWSGGHRGFRPAVVEGGHQLFGFLTTDVNSIVAAIHPKAMPVILALQEEVDQWLSAKPADALKLRRPLPDHALRIVASGYRADG